MKRAVILPTRILHAWSRQKNFPTDCIVYAAQALVLALAVPAACYLMIAGVVCNQSTLTPKLLNALAFAKIVRFFSS